MLRADPCLFEFDLNEPGRGPAPDVVGIQSPTGRRRGRGVAS